MMKTINDIVEVTSGFAFRSKSFKDNSDTGYPIIRIQNLNGTTTEFKYWDLDYNEKYLIYKNDILLSLSGNVKLDVWEGPTGLLNQRIIKIDPKNGVIKDWLFYLLQFIVSDIEKLSKKSIISNISVRDFKKINVKVPSVSKQKEIAEILNKAKEVKTKRQQQIESLSALKQSIFMDMFGDPNSSNNKYPKQRIGNLIEVQTGKTPSRKNSSYWNNGDVPWIKTTEVNNKRIESSSEFVTEEAVYENNLKLFPTNTIFIAMYGQGKTRGQSALLTFPATCNQACAALLPNESMDELFVWNQLLLQYESLRSLGRGGNQPNLNLSLVRDFEILTPPLSLQQEYSNSIKRIDEIIEKVKNSYSYLEQLFNSLIYKAFSGELFKEDIKI